MLGQAGEMRLIPTFILEVHWAFTKWYMANHRSPEVKKKVSRVRDRGKGAKKKKLPRH